MKRAKTGLRHISQIPVETDVPGRPGVTRQLLSRDEASGSKTRLLTMPPNYRSALSREKDGLMESHVSSEEIFVLEGVMSFGRWYDIRGLGYTFHPPGWTHPADQQTEFGYKMLIKSGADPVDFTFTPPPPNWNGAEYSLIDSPESTDKGVTRRDVESVPRREITLADGTATGLFSQPLLNDGPDGWSTWMLTVPPSWKGGGRGLDVTLGGLEFYVLSGDLSCRIDGVLSELTAGNYYSNPDRLVLQSTDAFSRNGCYVICWTRG